MVKVIKLPHWKDMLPIIIINSSIVPKELARFYVRFCHIMFPGQEWRLNDNSSDL